jgi:hypothetical protein
MNAIGGYFGLELGKHDEYHVDAVRLNTGRNALEYLLIAGQYQKIYLPYYTCDVLLEPINKLGIAYEFYNINEQMEAIFDVSVIGEKECFLYTNYFGMKDDFVDFLQRKCVNLIVDNAQAFYAEPLNNVDTFYSPRKFFGVTDGAYLYSNKLVSMNLKQDVSHTRFEHLLRRLDISAENGYPYFINNDESLSDMPILKMSNLTQKILASIDYAAIAKIRKENYDYLDQALKDLNRISFKLNSKQVPMVYPFYSNDTSLRKRLIEHGVYTAQYWPNVLEWVSVETIEWRLANNLIHLPIDQRYSQEDLNKIIKIISHEHHW